MRNNEIYYTVSYQYFPAITIVKLDVLPFSCVYLRFPWFTYTCFRQSPVLFVLNIRSMFLVRLTLQFLYWLFT